MNGLVDLHVHTSASDGTLAPAEVIEAAAQAGLVAVAITDHDTVDGVSEALAAGERLGVEVVPGVEFSVAFAGPGFMHLVGLFIDPDHQALAVPLSKIASSRHERTLRIIAKLNKLGVKVTIEQVAALSGGGQTGRPHISQAIVDSGYASNLREAMERYLRKGRPAYHDRFRLAPAEAIEVIHRAGGLAVLAHPVSLGLEGPRLSQAIAGLAKDGLDGIEACCPTQNGADQIFLRGVAKKLDLLISGGSDFHGAYKPDIRLGVGNGSLRVGAEILERLRAAWQERSALSAG